MISLSSLQHKNQLFWLLNIGGWLLVGALNYLGAYLTGEEWAMFWFRVAGVAVGIVTGWGLRTLYRRCFSWSLKYRVLLVLFVSVLVAIPHTAATNWVLLACYSEVNEFAASATLYRMLPVYVLHYLGWSMLYFWLILYRDMASLKQSEASARLLARDAQLKMLRYQLNPHFLFNTLNAISTLVLEKETKAANNMVIRLSEFLRQSLINDPMKQVTLEQEITALQLYLGIEKARFDERLKVRIDIDSPALEAYLPSLLLQPIVENSIKYAVSPSLDGGTITIAARLFAGKLLIEISDDGPGCSDAVIEGCGVGLENCKERLQAIYGSDFSFQYGNSSRNVAVRGFEVSLFLPLSLEEAEYGVL